METVMTSLVQRRLFWKDYLVGILGGIAATFVIDLTWIHYATSWWPWPRLYPDAIMGIALLFLIALWVGSADDDGLWVFPPCGVTVLVLLAIDLALKFVW